MPGRRSSARWATTAPRRSTAIGDTVNTASRLESLTKELKVELVVSQELLDRAGVDLSAAPQHEVDIRGRQGRIAVRAVLQARDLTSLSS